MSAATDPQALTDALRAKQVRMAPDSVNMAAAAGMSNSRLAGVPARARDTMDEQFPTAGLSAAEPEKDREMMAKLALQPDIETMPGYTRFGKLEARDEDFKWYQRKLAAEEAANFQMWFAQNFDHMSPADKKRAKELYPEFYKERKQLLKKQAKNLMKFAKLKLEGVQSFDDLMTQYMAETGRLDIGPLNHILNPEQGNRDGKTEQEMRFQRGLLSPFRVFGDEAVSKPNMGVKERKWQGQNFASRASTDNAKTGFRLGVDGTGFAPTGKDGDFSVQQQSDAQWWEVLSKSVTQ